MKRFFFSLIALSAAAIGCTQSALLETPDFGGTEISFSPYTGRTPVTKATAVVAETGLAATEGFNVYGFLTKEGGTQSLYMDNVNVYSPSKEGGDWTYDKLVYWPDLSSKSTLSFVAYGSNAINKGLDVTQTGFTYTVNSSVDNHVDLLVTAYKEGLTLESSSDKVTSTGQVKLTFNHLLSRVGFQLYLNKNESATRTVKIENITFSGKMPNQGSLIFTDYKDAATPKLTVSNQKGDVTYSDFIKQPFEATTSTSAAVQTSIIRGVQQTVNNTTSTNTNDKYMMIMPHTIVDGGNHEISVTYKVGTVGTGGTVTYPATSKTVKASLPTGFKFEAGRAYEFILKISTSAIKFEVDIVEGEWQDGATQPSYPLIPEDPNKVSAVAKVTGTQTTDIVLTAKEAGLGTLGVEYKENSTSVTTWTSKTHNDTYNANTPITISLSGLSANTEYLFRPYSEKNNVKTYYSESSFVTKAAIEVVMEIDNGVTEIYPDHVTVKCNYTSTVTLTEKGFCLVQGTGTPTMNDQKAINITSDTNSFTGTFDNLQPLTQYTCRAYAIINGVLSYSAPIPFTTAPIIETPAPNKEKCTFTVEASPANAKVKLEADGVTTVEKDGIASIEVEKGTTVRYTVSLNDNSETGSCIVEHSQYIKVTLVEDGDNVTSPSGPPADEWDEEDPEIDFSK